MPIYTVVDGPESLALNETVTFAMVDCNGCNEPVEMTGTIQKMEKNNHLEIAKGYFIEVKVEKSPLWLCGDYYPETKEGTLESD